MNKTNLMPVARQLTQARSARWQMWSILIGCVITGSVVTYAACAVATADADTPMPAEFTRTSREIADFNAQAAKAKSELLRARHEVLAARSVSEQPDLSLLLRLISRNAGEQILLTRCEMVESEPKPSPADPDLTAIGSLRLRLDGYGKTQAAVAGFVLQLETSGAFDRVALLQSHRQPVLGSPAETFRIECLMQPKGGPTP